MSCCNNCPIVWVHFLHHYLYHHSVHPSPPSLIPPFPPHPCLPGVVFMRRGVLSSSLGLSLYLGSTLRRFNCNSTLVSRLDTVCVQRVKSEGEMGRRALLRVFKDKQWGAGPPSSILFHLVLHFCSECTVTLLPQPWHPPSLLYNYIQDELMKQYHWQIHTAPETHVKWLPYWKIIPV